MIPFSSQSVAASTTNSHIHLHPLAGFDCGDGGRPEQGSIGQRHGICCSISAALGAAMLILLFTAGLLFRHTRLASHVTQHNHDQSIRKFMIPNAKPFPALGRQGPMSRRPGHEMVPRVVYSSMRPATGRSYETELREMFVGQAMQGKQLKSSEMHEQVGATSEPISSNALPQLGALSLFIVGVVGVFLNFTRYRRVVSSARPLARSRLATIAMSSTAGRSTAGRSTAGKSTAGKSTAGRSTAGKSTAGKSTAGKSTAGRSTAGRSYDTRGSVSAEDSFAVEMEADVMDPGSLILCEQPHYLVANKPTGIVVHEGEDCLVNMLSAAGHPYLLPVHRIDATSSGVLLLAKTSSAASSLQSALAAPDTVKTYLAVASGCPKVKEGTWSQTLARRAQGRKNPRGLTADRQPCATSYKVLASAEHLSLLELTLIKGGRTHQIRRHAALNGFPIAGDTRYGKQRHANHVSRTYGLEGALIHAWRLSIRIADNDENDVSFQRFVDSDEKETKKKEGRVQTIKARVSRLQKFVAPVPKTWASLPFDFESCMGEV